MVATMKFQSTLPRGSDPALNLMLSTFFQISIHAPSRERLSVDIDGDAFVNISIHAPSRERPCSNTDSCPLPTISIHAPSRERHHSGRFVWPSGPFQSTLPRGSDGLPIVTTKPTLKFQSTLPRGSDLALPSRLYLPVHFNPRSLAGATQIIIQV